MLVEDERVTAIAEEATLRRHGYDVVVAATGEEAVGIVADDAISLILMDIDLGAGMDGTQAAEAILSEREIPIVFLTGHAERDMVERVRGITRYGYVLKNSGEFVLIQAVEMAFELFEARRESGIRERWYRSVANLTGEIIVQYTTRGEWTFINDRACEFWGATRDELVSQSYLDYVHPDDREKTAAAAASMIETGNPALGLRNRQRTPSGWRIVEWNSELLRDPEGQVSGFQATGRDVTERDELERALRYNNDLLQRTMDASPASIVVLNPDGTIRYANRRACDVLGITESGVGETRYNDPDWRITDENGGALPPEQLPFAVVHRTHESVRGVRHAIVRGDGRFVVLSVNAAPLFDDSGELSGVVAGIEDITEQLDAERQLRENESRLQSISDNVPGIVYQYEMRPDGRDRFTFVSRSVSEVLGLEADAILADSSVLFDRVAEGDFGRLRDAIADSHANLDTFAVEGRLVGKDGSTVWAGARGTPHRAPDGTVVWTGVAIDITARVEAEHQVRRLLEEKEILLREVHHRVKNDLSLMQSLLSLQRLHSASDETRLALSDTIARLSVMVRVYEGLHATGDLGRIPINTLLHDLAGGLRDAILPPQTVLTIDVCEIEVEPSVSVSIGIIVNELVTNSAKYASDDHTVQRIGVKLAVSDGRSLSVVVRDDGRGFPESVVQRREFGYGLTIVEALAEQHGGRLLLANEGGAVATVTLPAALEV
ncbi:MAG: PAS domain S-box protein [Spirochaetota bacterium]